MNSQNLIDFIEEHFENELALTSMVGVRGVSQQHNWGGIPSHKAEIDAVDGIITRIRTWHGGRWNAKSGYGSPLVDTNNLCFE